MLKQGSWYTIFSYNIFIIKLRIFALGVITINKNTTGWKITLKSAISICLSNQGYIKEEFSRNLSRTQLLPGPKATIFSNGMEEELGNMLTKYANGIKM